MKFFAVFRAFTVATLAAGAVAGGPARAANVFALHSPDFPDGGLMPVRAEYRGMGCRGGNISPRLVWSGAPAGTRSFALTVHDPDAPMAGGVWHWVRFDVPGRLRSLASGSPPGPRAGRDGTTTFEEARYDGPCPPPGDRPHHYEFVLLALDVPAVPGAGATTTGPGLAKLLAGHVLGEARLTGRFGRPR